MAIVLFVPLIAIIIVPYIVLRGAPPTIRFPSVGGLIVTMLVILISIPVHEGLHAVGFMLGGVSWGDIKFGLKHLTPYAHCKVPLPTPSYRISVLLPGIVLGLIPGVVGIITGSGVVTLYALLMLASAAGDAIIILLLINVPGDSLVLDHPDKIGCEVILL